MEKFNSLPNIFYLGFYHPKYNYYEGYKENNEYFNEYSQKILDLKDRNYEAIECFTQELDKIIDDEQVVITAVPSSNAKRVSSGITYLSKQLLKNKRNFIDGTTCVKRMNSIPEQSQSSEKRTKKRNKDSIEIQNNSLIKEQRVIILDDVLTTGNTIKACQELLLEAGAKEVKIIVLGKTIRNIDYYYDLLEEYYPNFIRNKSDQLINEERNRQWKKLSDSYKIKHQQIDEWASDEHEELEYSDPGNEYEHYCIDQQAEERHNWLDHEQENDAGYIYQKAEKVKAGRRILSPFKR